MLSSTPWTHYSVPSISWPGGALCAVGITFDMDAIAGMASVFDGRKAMPAALAAGAYGPIVGTPRILRMLEVLGIRATFFVPGADALQFPNIVRDIVSHEHEVGHHGYNHLRNSCLSLEEEEQEITDGILAIEELTGKRPQGYRAPWWDWSENTAELLIKHGFRYDSSLAAADSPFSISIAQNTILELPPSYTLDDWGQYGHIPTQDGGAVFEEPDKVTRLWMSEFSAYAHYNGAYILTLHPWLSGRPSRVIAIAELLKNIQHSGLAWIATCGEIAAYVEQKLREIKNEY